MSSPHSILSIRFANLAAALTMAIFLTACSKTAEQEAMIKELKQEVEDLRNENGNYQSRVEELEKNNSELKNKVVQAEQAASNAKNQVSNTQRELENLRTTKAAELERARSEAPAKKLAAVKSGFDQQLAAILSIEGDVSKGRGVVVKADGKTWLYSSAQIFSGNSKLAIKGPSGTAITKFGEFQIAPDSPVCRLEIQQEMPASFEIAPNAAVETSSAFITTILPAENVPMQAIECLSTDVMDNEFGIDASATDQSAGCPVVAADSGKVVAILAQVPPPAALWQDPQAGANAIPAAPRAHRINRTVDWKKSSIAAFLAERRKIDEINHTTRLLQALALIRPSSSGLQVDAMVAGTNITVRQILDQNGALPLVVELKKLHSDLSGKGVRVAERDISRRAGGCFQEAVSLGKRQVQELKIATISPFHKPLVEESLMWRAEADQALAATIQGLAK